MPELDVEQSDGVATVVLSRPAAMNALSKSLRQELVQTFAELAADTGVRVVILTGAGDRAFCAGLDLKELGADGRALDGVTGRADEFNPVRAIERCPKPVIGAINGVAITGGFELALACDVLIVSTRARFADTHARVGIMPGWGLSQKLSRLIGPYRAKELSLSGNFIDADTASRWGLVNRVIGPDDLMPAARALARDMAQLDGKTLAGMKHLIDTGYGLGLREALEFETRWSGEHNSRVSKEEVESRRQAVLARGRTQQGGAA